MPVQAARDRFAAEPPAFGEARVTRILELPVDALGRQGGRQLEVLARAAQVEQVEPASGAGVQDLPIERQQELLVLPERHRTCRAVAGYGIEDAGGAGLDRGAAEAGDHVGYPRQRRAYRLGLAAEVLEHTGLVAVDEEAGDRDGREERLDDWDAGADARHDLPQALDLLVEQSGVALTLDTRAQSSGAFTARRTSIGSRPGSPE
jgi:hypothetical protein